MKTVTVQFVLTLESPNGMPIRFQRSVAIKLGTRLDGTPILDWVSGLQREDVGALEVSLALPPTAAFEFPSPPVEVTVTRVEPDGVLRSAKTCQRVSPKTELYRQIELLAEEYTSQTSDS